MAAAPYNVAIIGYGLSAKVFHIPFITQTSSLRLYAVLQRNPTADSDASHDHPGIQLFRDAATLLADPAVHVVVVTSLPDSHFELTKAALEAGKHVVVEKPFVPTVAEADELVRIAKTTGKLLAVYQNRRWDADYLAASQLVKDGALGRIVEFESHFDRYSPTLRAGWKAEPRPGNGAIYDLGTHLLDQIVHLFGLPAKVTAFIWNQRAGAPTGYDSGVGDSFTVLLHYADGLLATAKVGVLSAEQDQLRFWVRGEKGSFKKYNLDPQEEQLLSGLSNTSSELGREPSSNYNLTLVKDGNIGKEPVAVVPKTYLEYYRILADALDGKGDVPVKAEQAASVIRLIELAKESSRTGKTLDV
ncbi:putative NAD binding Rossmann fold oxidoreductase [Phyllosticta citrichinensis]|uniref:NAD binding Rossmann fold oxidoreductase n=1 Tax=Phyllosticta citrichinensis TaxID=1130410 RepID=A0ABR1XJT0_9PEZI